MRGIGPLPRGTHAVTLGGLRKDHGRLAAVRGGRGVGSVDLDRVVTATTQCIDIAVRKVGDQRREFRVARKELLSVVVTVSG